MATWNPATLEEVQQLLAEGLSELHPAHRKLFERIRIVPRQVPVADDPGEFVYVVAEYQGKLLYYSDVEDGWELEFPNSIGGIDARGCNQFKLIHVVHQAFGDPSV
jgi:hypothetical protein